MIDLQPAVPLLEVDLDGRIDEKNDITYIGKAVRMADGTYRCLARVGDALCRVEVRITNEQARKLNR